MIEEEEEDSSRESSLAELMVKEEEQKKMREDTPDPSVAHLQEELIAVRLREAEVNLALKDLRHRVQELTQLWTKHVQDQHGERGEAAKPYVTSTPSKKLGLFWDRSSEAADKVKPYVSRSEIIPEMEEDRSDELEEEEEEDHDLPPRRRRPPRRLIEEC